MPTKKVAVKRKMEERSKSSAGRNPEPVETVVDDQEQAVSETSVEEQIEDQEYREAGSSIGGLVNRARDLVGNGTENIHRDFGSEKSKKSKSKKSNYVPQYMRETTANIQTLIVSMLVVLVASWNVPKKLKPEDEEIQSIGTALTNILARHINITGRLTLDTIDLIAIIATVSTYYMRTAPLWKDYIQTERASEREGKEDERESKEDERESIETGNSGNVSPLPHV